MKIFVQPSILELPSMQKLQQEFPEITFEHTKHMTNDYDCLIAYPHFVRNLDIKEYTKLQWIQLLTAGFDGIDLEKLRDHHILLTNAKDVYSKTIAEDVLCKILIFNRHVKQYLQAMRQQVWEPIANEPEIANSIVGIIGAGSIAQEIAKRMQACEAKVIGYRQTPQKKRFFDEIYTGKQGLIDVVSQSDYIVIALPLNNQTKNLFDYPLMRQMKKNALLINIARGDIIVQDDLIKVLQEGLIRGAALDVTTPEPLPKNHPLWTMDNVYITPHNAMSSPFIYDRLAQVLKHNLKLFLAGKIESESIH